MLHMRSHSAATLWIRLGASDPGLLRLLMAVRGTLSVFLTTLVALLASHLLGAEPVEFAGGIVLSLLAPFLMREPTRRQRQRTLLLLAIPAAGSNVAASFLHGGLAGNVVFLLAVFCAFLLQTRTPRGVGLGLVGVVGLYVGLFLHLPPATLPVQMLGIVVALPVTFLASFVLVPVRPAWVLRRMVRTVQARAALVLAEARRGGAAAEARLRGSVAALNASALAADDQLAVVTPHHRGPLRLRLVELELAVAHLVAALDRAPGNMVRALHVHERRLRRSRWAARHRAATPAPTAPTALTAALGELAQAAAALGDAVGAADDWTPPAPTASLPPGPLAWRVATRVTLASALAMAGGMALSPERWFWAVITTYVVFLGVRSRGDTAVKGAQRLAGTLLGLLGGLGLASLAGHAVAVQTVLLLLAVFGMYYLFLVSYTLAMFCVTLLLGLLYDLMGASLEPLLVLRLEETAVGTAAALLVAIFVLPVRTRDQVTMSGRAVLASLADVVRSSREFGAEPSAGSPLVALRRLDRQVADFRLALVPLTVGRTLLRRTALERPVPELLECVHWARVLAVAAERGSGPADREATAAQARRIEARLAQLAATSAAGAGAMAAPPAEGALTPLDRLDFAVTLLSERLALLASEGFVLLEG